MKNQIKILLAIITVILGINSISAQGNFEADGSTSQGAVPSLHGDNRTALYWNSNDAGNSQLILGNKQKTVLGKFQALSNTNGKFVGIKNSSNQWTYLVKQNAWTVLKVADKNVMSLDVDGVNIAPRDNANKGARLTLLGAGTNREWRIDNFYSRLRMYYAGVVMFQINSDGNVGIGNNVNAKNKLDVDGTIRAKEVIVQSDWADYVFDEAYELPSLNAEEENIESNGHLLGFDSEEAMAGDVHLGDIAKKQQVKIEEMMLHLIEMKKEIKQLQKDKVSLNTELELLKQ